MDVFLGNENYFQDKLAATNKCHSPQVVDNEEKSMSLDIEHFLTTVGDVSEISRKGTELNLPVPIVSCLDTLIENVGELHKFDSINNLTISSNLIEDLNILSSKSVSEQSLSNYAFSDLENCNTNESSLQKMEKSCPIPEDGELTPFEVNVSRSGNSNSAILFETDHTPSNDDLGQKVEETVIDGQFNESEDCGIQLSADEQSDQFKISEIKQSKDLDLMPSKDLVNPIEMDINLLESNSNEISFMGLNNTVVNFELEEEKVIESDKNENKVKGNSNKRYMEKNCAISEDKCESEILKGIENNANLKEKEADVIKYSTDKCLSVADKLHSSSDMNCCQVVLNRLKPHILKKYLYFSNLNPIQMQSDAEKDINLNIDGKEKLQRKLNRNLLTRNVNSVNKGKKLNNKNSSKVNIMKKQSLKSKKTGKQLSIEKNYKYADTEEEMFNRFSNLIKCSKLKKAVHGILVRNTLLNESFENEQKNKTMNSDKNKIKELDEKLLNQQKECEKRNSPERKLTVKGDSSCHSKSNGLFKSKLLNLKVGDSLVSKRTYNEFDKTQNSSFMTKPCKVLLERLSFETIKMYSLDVSLFSISKSDNVSCSDKGTNLLDSFLSSSSDEQEDEEIIFRKIQNKSSFKRLKETSYKKLSSNLRNDGVDLKSQKMVSSLINWRKGIVTELNKNISSHVLVFDMIKKQRGSQKKEFKVTSEGDSLYFQNLKYVKSSKKSNKITVVKNKCMHKSSSNMKLIINNNLNDPGKKSQEVKYNRKEIDLKAPYSIKECRITLEKLDSHCLESYLYNSKLNQIPEVCLSYQYNVNTDINACMVNQIVHIDRDGNQIVKSPKHLLKKHAKNKTREECVQSTKLKENILKENFLCDVKRKIGSTLLKKDSSKPDNIIYHYGKSVAAEGPVLSSGDSQDNLHLNSVPQVNAMDKNWMELDETNRLIKEQIWTKNCSVMLKQCDSAILEKYLGTDWSKKLSKCVHRKSFKADLIDFEDSLVSNSTHSVFPNSEYGDISESNHQMDLSSDSDDCHSIEQVLEFHDKKIPKDLFCKSCTRNFKTYSSLLSHEKKTHKTYCFKCVLCKYVSKNRDSYINHMKRNHPEVEPYVCDYPKCEKSFQNKKKLSDHKKSHQRYCCRFCKKRYAKKNLLLRHVSDCH
ncbi:unnamed protein product [Larinioides sclopetarius]|uniref:C2H2-type domain-containing protein n=1 Tax=Larinioides sclopetarius TaxID=280406 RepID=A0AAV2BS78_9ARAC